LSATGGSDRVGSESCPKKITSNLTKGLMFGSEYVYSVRSGKVVPL
jgi:hypothetical protein